MELKKQILRLLAADGRMSARDMAERLDSDEKTIADMIEQLERDKVIFGYCAMFHETELPENAVKAIIEVKIRPERDGGFDKIARRLSRFPQVSSLYLMSGGFDLMVEVKGRNLNEVAMFVSSKLATIDGVLSTVTHFLLKKYKGHGTVLCDGPQDERMLIVP